MLSLKAGTDAHFCPETSVGLHCLDGWQDGDMQDELSPIGYVKAEVAEHLPEYSRAVGQVRRELGAYGGLVHPLGDRGVSLLWVQSSNDFIDLLDDIGMGRGRPAMRGLRSIFESLITVLDIASGDSDTADRYAEQHAVVMYRAATMTAGLTGLTGNDLRSERHRRRKQERIHKQAHDEAIAKRGGRLRRSWTDASLEDRAARHGYAEDYDLYRVLSASTHVSAGGVGGVERRYGEASVFRFGPDLLNCPMALNEGLRYFRLFVEALSAHTGIPAERLIGTLSALESLRGAYRKLIHRIDGDLWPDHPPLGMMVVRALLPDGQRKWLLHDTQQGRIIECSVPREMTTSDLEAVEESLDEAEKAASYERQETHTIAICEVRANPLPHAKWCPEGFIVPVDRDPYELTLPWDQ